MSLQAPSSTVCFPNQQAILNYINHHPLKDSIDKKIIQTKVPGSQQKIAQYFANKKMLFNEIEQNLKEVLAYKKSPKEFVILSGALQDLVLTYEGIDKNPSNTTSKFIADLKRIQKDVDALDQTFGIVIHIYSKVLHDLIDNATYLPSTSKEGKKCWTRQVPVTDLTKQTTT